MCVAAVRSVEHPLDYREPCIYCERCVRGALVITHTRALTHAPAPPRFDHASEEHCWTSRQQQRSISLDDGNSMASTHKSSAVDDDDDWDVQDIAVTRADERPSEGGGDAADAAADAAAAASEDNRRNPAGESPGDHHTASSDDAHVLPFTISPSEAQNTPSPTSTSPSPELLEVPTAAPSTRGAGTAAQDAEGSGVGDGDGGMHCDVSIERVELGGNNDQGAEELDGR